MTHVVVHGSFRIQSTTILYQLNIELTAITVVGSIHINGDATAQPYPRQGAVQKATRKYNLILHTTIVCLRGTNGGHPVEVVVSQHVNDDLEHTYHQVAARAPHSGESDNDINDAHDCAALQYGGHGESYTHEAVATTDEACTSPVDSVVTKHGEQRCRIFHRFDEGIDPDTEVWNSATREGIARVIDHRFRGFSVVGDLLSGVGSNWIQLAINSATFIGV